jgi:HK97 family phage prohead protease
VGIVSEILTRSDGVFADIDFKLRLIDLIAVPWEKPASVYWRGEQWTEVFERGAFNGVEARAGEVRVNREHRKGDTVGKVVELDPFDERGLFARLKIVKGSKGDELLHLAEEEMVSASIGYRANKGSDVVLDKQNMTRRVRNAFLDHLGMVEDPAFKEARVLAVRGDDREQEAVDGSPLATPVLDEMMRDPIIMEIMQRR